MREDSALQVQIRLRGGSIQQPGHVPMDPILCPVLHGIAFTLESTAGQSACRSQKPQQTLPSPSLALTGSRAHPGTHRLSRGRGAHRGKPGDMVYAFRNVVGAADARQIITEMGALPHL